MKNKEEKISDALLKVALGYQVAEVTEEYAEVDGELKLTKRKKTKKDVPPDLKAVQLLLSAENEGDYTGWTDEQLAAEKERLLAELKEKQDLVKDGEDVLAVDAESEKVSTEIVKKKTVKVKKVAGSVELNVKKACSMPKKSVANKTAKNTKGKATKTGKSTTSTKSTKTTKNSAALNATRHSKE